MEACFTCTTDLGNSIKILDDSRTFHSVFKEVPDNYRACQAANKQLVYTSNYSESACVVSLSQVVELYLQWTLVFPKIRPFYAYKCNYDPELSKLLIALGCGLDCASDKEIDVGLSLGASPKDIIFAHPQKVPEHIGHAKQKGVDLSVFDSEEELMKIKSIFPETRLLVRIRCADKSAREPFTRKFGCSVLQACKLLDLAKQHGMQVVGVCFHVGTYAQSSEVYERALRKSRLVFDHASKIGLSFNILDIGGGFPGTKEDFPTFRKIANSVNKTIEAVFGDQPNLTIMAEPGRYFGCSPLTLVLKIIGKGIYVEDESEAEDVEPQSINKEVCMRYFFTDGAYGSFCRRMEAVRPTPLTNIEGRPYYKSVLYGPVCAEIDCICEQVLPEYERGEWLYFENAGAYSPNFHCAFNGFVKPPRLYIVEAKDRSLFLKLRNLKME